MHRNEVSTRSAAIILAREGDRGPACPIHEVGQCAVIAHRAQQHREHAREALEHRLACDPAALDRDDEGHQREARAADADGVAIIVRARAHRAAIRGQPARRVRSVPEKAERLALQLLQ